MSEDLIERLRARGKPVCIEASAEIERLRANLAKAEKVIEPFAGCFRDANEAMERFGYAEICPEFKHLRAAAEWMEKGDE